MPNLPLEVPDGRAKKLEAALKKKHGHQLTTEYYEGHRDDIITEPRAEKNWLDFFMFEGLFFLKKT